MTIAFIFRQIFSLIEHYVPKMAMMGFSSMFTISV